MPLWTGAQYEDSRAAAGVLGYPGQLVEIDAVAAVE